MSGVEGLVVLPASSGFWAWCGVEVVAAVDLTEATEYSALSEAERYERALADDAAYVSRFLDAAPGQVVELRWRRNVERDRLELFVIARCYGLDESAVTDTASRLRTRLANTPRHVTALPVYDAGRLASLLAPIGTSDGLVEVSKRCLVAEPQRPDSPWSYYFAVQPFNVRPISWEPVLAALQRRTSTTILSVALEPYRFPDHDVEALSRCATEFGRLARAATFSPGALYAAPMQLTPDSFAVEAEHMYTEAVRRYRGPVFRFRVTIASDQAVDDGFGHLVAMTVSPPMAADDTSGTYMERARTGMQAFVQRPTGNDVAIATGNLRQLSMDRWGGDPRIWERPDPPPPWARALSEVVDANEATAVLRFPAAVHGAIPGFSVTKPGVAGFSDYSPTGPSLVIGDSLIDGEGRGEVRLALPDLTKHALVVGTTGHGKTNTVLNLCRQLWTDHRIPFLVIEPVNADRDDYRRLLDTPGLEELMVLTAGDDATSPFRINPFEVPRSTTPRSHIASMLASFDAAFGLWDPLPNIYRRALTELYRDAAVVLDEPLDRRPAGGWPTLDQFVGALHEEVRSYDYAGEMASNIRAGATGRAESLLEGAPAPVLDCDESFPIGDLLARPVVLELSRLSENPKEQALVMALVLATMTSHYKANITGSGLRHVTIIEEAHRLLAAPSPEGSGAERQGDARARAAEMFANTLAENRKYGEALVIVEQDPSKLITDAYKNTNLKVMHRLPAASDRSLIGQTMRFSDDQERYAASLEQGQAFVFHDHLDRPTLTRVGVFDGPPEPPGRQSVRERFRLISSVSPSIAASARPFVGCSGCQHVCEFRARALSVAGRKQTARVKAFINGFPTDPTDQPQWWGQLVDLVASLQPLREPPDPAGRADELTCRFIHLMRRAYRRDQTPWIDRFRVLVRDE